MQEIKWQERPEFDRSLAAEFSSCSDLVSRLLFNRGIKERAEIKKFVEGTFEHDAYDEFLFQDMSAAVDLLIKHVKAKSKITVYGDYDADGVTSSAIVADTLRLFNVEVDAYIPHRVLEGYGVNKQAVDYIAENGSKLIITVDNGIRSKAEIAYAKSKGLEVIVTDHHVPPDDTADYPDALIINPSLPQEKYPEHNLAGAGVAFKFISALILRSKLNDAEKEKLRLNLLDLVAVGTVADCVKLSGENRLLVKKGLEVLSETKRAGLAALLSAAKSGVRVDTWNIGFQIAPRLNAAGRLDHANTAFRLLMTKDRAEAEKLAEELNLRNQERQRITDEIFAEVVKQIDASKDKILIGVYDLENDKSIEETVWNEGVVGLVAGRIANRYFRPALVITKTETGYKGSGRSIPGFNLIKAIERCSEHLDKFGGHPAACGFSFDKDSLKDFMSAIKQIAEEEISEASMNPELAIDAVLELSAVNEKLYREVSVLEPYGEGNERPVFASRNLRIADVSTMGADNRHIKFKLKTADSTLVSAISFNGAEKWRDFHTNDVVDVAYHLDLNTFNGRTEAQLKIIDIKYANQT